MSQTLPHGNRLHKVSQAIGSLIIFADTSYLISFARLAYSCIPSQPQGGEQQEAYARANGSHIVRPCGTEESGVSVVSWWDNRDCHGAVEVCPSELEVSTEPAKKKIGMERTLFVCSQ